MQQKQCWHESVLVCNLVCRIVAIYCHSLLWTDSIVDESFIYPKYGKGQPNTVCIGISNLTENLQRRQMSRQLQKAIYSLRGRIDDALPACFNIRHCRRHSRQCLPTSKLSPKTRLQSHHRTADPGSSSTAPCRFLGSCHSLGWCYSLGWCRSLWRRIPSWTRRGA